MQKKIPPNTNNVAKPQYIFAGVKLHIIYIYSSRLGFVLTKPTVSSHEDSHFERSPPYRGKILPIFSYMSEHSLYTKLYHS